MSAAILSCPTIVSIHAPREGCDYYLIYFATKVRSFNSRTPGGVRQLAVGLPRLISPFQFTHPGRGATCGRQHRKLSR